MNLKNILAIALVASCLPLAACGKKPPEPVHTPKQAKPAEAEAEAAPARTSFEERPEEVLRNLKRRAP